MKLPEFEIVRIRDGGSLLIKFVDGTSYKARIQRREGEHQITVEEALIRQLAATVITPPICTAPVSCGILDHLRHTSDAEQPIEGHFSTGLRLSFTVDEAAEMQRSLTIMLTYLGRMPAHKPLLCMARPIGHIGVICQRQAGHEGCHASSDGTTTTTWGSP